MAFWMIPLALAAAGALADKKNPLRGAALGAAAGMTGGAAMGAMGGAGGLLGAGSTAASTGATQAGLLAAQEAGLGASSLGWGGATTGMQGGLNSLMGAEAGSSAGGLLGNAATYGKPMGQVMNAASQGHQMAAASDPQVQAPPPPQLTQQPMNLNETIGMGQQARQYEDQEAERRKQLLAMYSNNIGRA